MQEISGGGPSEIILGVKRLNALEKAVVERFSGGRSNIQEGRDSASQLIRARLFLYIIQANSPDRNLEDLEATGYYAKTYPELLSQMALGNWSAIKDYFLGEARESMGESADMLRHPDVFEEKTAVEFEKYGEVCMYLANSLGVKSYTEESSLI